MNHFRSAFSRRGLAAASLFAAGLGYGSEVFGQAKAVLEILPSVESVTPGATFQLALKFKLQQGWHLYWINPGDSGLPPQVKWAVPNGFKVGDLQFPTPTRHTAPGNIVSNLLAGEPVLMVDVTAPAKLTPGENITLTADVSWLVCQEICVREKQAVRLTLPAGGADGAKPANADVFARARQSMPVKQSQHVTIQPSSSKDKVKPGDSFEVVLQLLIPEGFTLAPQQPAESKTAGTDVFVKPATGLAFERPVFPPAAEAGKGYQGRVFIRIPAKVESGVAAGPIPVGGILVFQAQNTKSGERMTQEALEWELKVESAQ